LLLFDLICCVNIFVFLPFFYNFSSSILIFDFCFFLLIDRTFCLFDFSPSSACNGKGKLNGHKPVTGHHKTLSDRVTAANRMIKEIAFPGEVFCDTMANEVMLRYDAHPERLCIVQDGIVVHYGGNPYKLVRSDIESIIGWLAQRDTRQEEVNENVDEAKEEPAEEGECSS
jgi:hypothetical protein